MEKYMHWNSSIHLCVYVMWNKFRQHQGEIVFIEVFMAHWHPVAVFMTHCARHTTKQPDSLKGIRTNQYRRQQTLIIQQDIFSEAYCWVTTHITAQETSAQFYFHNGDNTWMGLNLHAAERLVSGCGRYNLCFGNCWLQQSGRLYSKQYFSALCSFCYSKHWSYQKWLDSLHSRNDNNNQMCTACL